MKELQFAYNPKTGHYEMAANQNPPATIELEQRGILPGVQIGNTFIGGSVALVASELFSGLLGNVNVPFLQGVNSGFLTKLASAWALSRWRFGLPGEAAKIGASFLVFDAARQLIGLDNILAGLTSGLRRNGNGGTPASNLVSFRSMNVTNA